MLKIMPRNICLGCRVKGPFGPFLEHAEASSQETMQNRARLPRRKRTIVHGSVIGHASDRWIVRWDEGAVPTTDYRGSALSVVPQVSDPPITDEQR